MSLLFATFFALLLVIVGNINIFTFSFNASSKFGLRFTIATMRLRSISPNLSKVISFSILFFEFKIFLVILDNSTKTAFSVTWSSNVDLHFFILKISRIQPSFTFRVTLNVLFLDRDFNRGCLFYMFSLRFSGSKFLINLRPQFCVRKIFSCT